MLERFRARGEQGNKEPVALDEDLIWEATRENLGVARPRPDLVLVTVNEHETTAVHDAFFDATSPQTSELYSGLFHYVCAQVINRGLARLGNRVVVEGIVEQFCRWIDHVKRFAEDVRICGSCVDLFPDRPGGITLAGSRTSERRQASDRSSSAGGR